MGLREVRRAGVVIVAYSGGYFPAAWAMHHGGVGDRLRGVVMLDALYGEFDTYLRWIARRELAFFFSAYSRSVREENAAFQKLLTERNIDFATAMPGKLAPGSVTFVDTGEEVQHNDFVTKAWVDDPLKDVLAKNSGIFPHAAAQTNPTPLSSAIRDARSADRRDGLPRPLFPETDGCYTGKCVRNGPEQYLQNAWT